MKELIIIGYGAHGRVIEEAARTQFKILGYIDPKNQKCILSYLGSDEEIDQIREKYPNAAYIIGVGDIQIRRQLINQYNFKNLPYISVIAPNANISSGAKIEEGVFISMGGIINTRACVAAHCIINTGSIIEHDCVLGHNVHVAPGAVLGGSVQIGSDTLIGLGARVKNNISIGQNAIVGVGAVVIQSVRDYTTVVGIPAREKGE